MKQRISKTLAWLLTAATVLTTLPNFTVWAAEAGRDDEAIPTEVTTTMEMVEIYSTPEADLPDNDELFFWYVEQQLYGYDMSTFGTRARASLNDIEKNIYDALKAKIEAVATNGGSTSFVLTDIAGLKTEWTNTELDVTSIDDTVVVETAFEAQFDFGAIVSALLADCPFDLYWYDKTDTGGAKCEYKISRSGTASGGVTKWTNAKIDELTFTFRVAKAYQSGNNTTVITDVAKVTAVKTAANNVVEANKSKTDYEKLVAYKEYICNAVSYNDEAAKDDYTGGYGDPWQLIYVFDGDSDTEVVCEGYSKAFQYLCDLGGLDCICVSGTMNGGTGAGPHMWNVVTLDEENYLVDVTNCDEGTIGAPDKLFMVGGTYAAVTGGNGYTYIIDEYNTVIYVPEDGDLGLAEDNYTPPAAPASYTITVSAAVNGSVTPNVTEAAEGETVTLTVNPTTGYVLDTLTVVYAGDNSVSVAEDNTFTMPAGNVTVTATFKACEHSGIGYTDITDTTHTYSCSVCGASGTEEHNHASGRCVCGKDAVIDTVAITVTAPAAGSVPQASVDGGTGYTAAISWDCAGNFGYNTAYTATVTLTAADGYKFADALTVTDWTVTVAPGGGSAALTQTYAATAKAKLQNIISPEDTTLSGCYADKAAVIEQLPKTVAYTAENGTGTFGIEWSCDSFNPAPGVESIFFWVVKESELADYDINGVATSGTISVTNGNADAVYNNGVDRTITYDGTTYDVSVMFTKDANAGAETYVITGGEGSGTLNGSVLTITKAGTFVITMKTAANGSYAEGSATATLTVNKASRSVSVSMEDWTYGETAKTPAVTEEGTPDFRYTGSSYDSDQIPKNAGTYTVTATFAETDLYTEATANDTFEIAKKTITASISGSVTKTYDGTDAVPDVHGLSIGLTGLVGSDVVTASAAFKYNGVNVGTTGILAENIVLSGADSGNYELEYSTASANVGTITKAPAPAIKWPTASALTYGQMLSESTLTSADANGNFVWQDGDTIPEVENTGYNVVYTPADTVNYDYSSVELIKSIAVNVAPVGQAAFNIAGPTSAVYGGPPITLSASGGSGDGTITWEISSGSEYASIAGNGTSATLTITGAGSVIVKATKTVANYDDAVDTHAISISKAAVAASGFTFTPPSDLVYSKTEKAATVNGDAAYGTITVAYYSDSTLTTVASPVNVGTYYVGVTTAGGANYEAVTVPICVGSFSITAKSVTVTADAKTMQYGGTVPELTYTHTLFDGDTFSGSLAVAASGTSDVGEYEITVGDLANSNYTIDYNSAKLTITQADGPAAPTVTGSYTVNGTTYTYTVDAVSGAEYSKDGTTWQDSNVFAGLTAGQKYTFYARIKETKNVKAGVTGASAEVDLSKFPGEGTVSIDDWTYGETTAVPVVSSATGNSAVSYLYESTDGKGYSGASAPSDAGAYKLTVTFDATATHNGTTASDTFTIRKAVPVVEAPSGLTASYGDTLADVTLPAGWDWSDADTTEVGDAGENSFPVVYTHPTDESNYEQVEKTVIITVSPITVTASVTVVGENFIFNGSAQTPGVVVKNGAVTIPESEYTVSYTNNINAGTAAVTIQDAAGGNYTVSGDTTFEIAKKASSALAGVERVFERNTATTGNEVDVEAMLPDDCGTASYTITSSGYTVLENVAIDTDGKLVFDTTTSSAAASDTITVKVVMQNYTDVTLTVSVILNDKVPQDITGVAAAEDLVYNGKAQKGYTGTPTSAYTGAYEITYTGRNSSYNSSAAPVNAGDYTVTFKIPDSDLHYSGSVSVNFTIDKAAAVVIADDKTAYVGSLKPTLTYRVTGLIGSDTISVSLYCDADMNRAGDTPIVVTASDPSGNYEITAVNGTLTVKHHNYLPGIPGFPQTPTIPTVPVTPPSVNVTVPISGDTAAINAKILISGNTAIIDGMNRNYLDEVIGEHVGTGEIVIDFSGLDVKEPITAVEIPVGVMKDIAEAVNSLNNDARSLEIILSDGISVAFDARALAEMALQAAGANMIISVESHEDVRLTFAQKRTLGDRPAYDINVISGGKYISDMGGKITVSVPYVLQNGEKSYGVAVCYVNAHGSREYCKTSYDPIEKKVSWSTDHLSLYMIDYNEGLIEACKKDRSCPMYGFTDMKMSEWYHDGVHFCIEHGLMQGVGNDHFDPAGTATRAMIVTILWRLEGSPVVDYLMEFEDVPQEMWYTEAIRWAASMKIVEGYGNGKFGTDDDVTREQIMAILNRYAAYKGWTADIALPMIPQYNCSVWAENNVNWADANGLLDNLGVDISDMTAKASRAELAVYLSSFIKNIAE